MNKEMQIRHLPNLTWGIEVKDFDLKSATTQDLLKIGSLVIDNHVVVLKHQDLSARRELEICKSIGAVVPVDAAHRCPQDENGQPIREIQRVTGLRHPDGTPMGLFGHDHDLDWHANRPSAEMEREPLIWLYAIQNVVGSRTSWANCTLAFRDLDQNTRTELDSLYGIFGFEPNRYTTWNEWKPHRNEDGIKIVRDVIGNGDQSLFFPFLQLFGFKNKSEEYSARIVEILKRQILKPEYVYHHEWGDGDVVISDQWNTIHKRWACDVSNRVLHRIAFGWDNVLNDRKVKKESLETHISC